MEQGASLVEQIGSLAVLRKIGASKDTGSQLLQSGVCGELTGHTFAGCLDVDKEGQGVTLTWLLVGALGRELMSHDLSYGVAGFEHV